MSISIEHLVRRVAEANDAYRDGKRDIEREVRREMAARIQDLADRRAVAAHHAHEAGASIARIGRDGLHTLDHGTASRAVARGAELVGLTTNVAEERRYESTEFVWIQDGVVRVTPTAEALAPVLTSIGLPAGAYEADFELIDGKVIPLTPAFTEGVGRQPVVALVGANAEYRSTLLEWAARS